MHAPVYELKQQNMLLVVNTIRWSVQIVENYEIILSKHIYLFIYLFIYTGQPVYYWCIQGDKPQRKNKLQTWTNKLN